MTDDRNWRDLLEAAAKACGTGKYIHIGCGGECENDAYAGGMFCRDCNRHVPAKDMATTGMVTRRVSVATQVALAELEAREGEINTLWRRLDNTGLDLAIANEEITALKTKIARDRRARSLPLTQEQRDLLGVG